MAEPNVTIKMANTRSKAMGTTMARRAAARCWFSNCPPQTMLTLFGSLSLATAALASSTNDEVTSFCEKLVGADAMREEYKAIVDAGFLVQVDDPSLATHYDRHPELTVEACRNYIAGRVELINYALRGIPADRVRFHTCYSTNVAPRRLTMKKACSVCCKTL